MVAQGKSEQMMEYIKKLRACTKWLLEREDANLVEIERITGQLDATHKQHSEIGTNLMKLSHHGYFFNSTFF
jgi:kinesin family member C1